MSSYVVPMSGKDGHFPMHLKLLEAADHPVLPDLELRSKPEPPQRTSSPSHESPDDPMQIDTPTHCCSNQATGSDLSRRISPLPEHESLGETPFAIRRRRRVDARSPKPDPGTTAGEKKPKRGGRGSGFGEQVGGKGGREGRMRAAVLLNYPVPSVLASRCVFSDDGFMATCVCCCCC